MLTIVRRWPLALKAMIVEGVIRHTPRLRRLQQEHAALTARLAQVEEELTEVRSERDTLFGGMSLLLGEIASRGPR
jgi:hypothetical protein